MTGEWVVVRKPNYGGMIALGVVGLLGLGGAVLALAANSPPVATVLAGGGLAMLVAVIVWYSVGQSKRWWAMALDGGFALRRPDGTSEFRYDDVVSAAVQYEKVYGNGILTHVKRTLTLWLAVGHDLPEVVTLVNKYAVALNDPLDAVVDGATEKVTARAKERLAAGRSVVGPDWTLDRGTLTVTQAKREPVVLPLAELQAVDEVEGNVCLWRRGDVEATVRVPVKEPDSFLLGRLLSEHLTANPPPPSEVDQDSGSFGRVIFNRMAKWPLWTLAIGALLLVGGLLLFTFNPGKDSQPIGGGAAAIGCVCMLFGAAGWGDYFRCHEVGVEQKSFLRKKRLRYRDIESFSYQATRHYHNGAYTGTQFVFRMRPIPEEKANAVNYQVQLNRNDDELDNLRDHIAGVIAHRMLGDLRAGYSAPWTANLEFRPDGLAFRPSGWLGRKESQVVPYHKIQDGTLNAGTFSLWVHGEGKAVCTEACGADNFFPGMFLFFRLLKEPEALSAGEGD